MPLPALRPDLGPTKESLPTPAAPIRCLQIARVAFQQIVSTFGDDNTGNLNIIIIVAIHLKKNSTGCDDDTNDSVMQNNLQNISSLFP